LYRCGDNVHFAAKFVKKFLRSRSNGMDVRAEIDRHNSDLGVRVSWNVAVELRTICNGSLLCVYKNKNLSTFKGVGRKILGDNGKNTEKDQK